MSPRSKKEYIEAIFVRYKNAPRPRKTLILDEFCATCGYHRKHAIRLLRGFKCFQKPKAKKRGRPPSYHPEIILKPLKQIWLAANLPCSKRLKAIVPLWLPGYLQHFGDLPHEALTALPHLSAATIDRLLKPIREERRLKGRYTPNPHASSIKRAIPVQPHYEKPKDLLGYLVRRILRKCDLVHHCGESAGGMYTHTLTATEITTGWTELRTLRNRAQVWTVGALTEIIGSVRPTSTQTTALSFSMHIWRR